MLPIFAFPEVLSVALETRPAVTTLPPVKSDYGTRVGYFTTDEQLIDSLPFRTNMQNILY
jgi:hypothetical protein